MQYQSRMHQVLAFSFCMTYLRLVNCIIWASHWDNRASSVVLCVLKWACDLQPMRFRGATYVWMFFASQYITIVHLSQCWRECHCHGSLALPIPVKMQQATAGGCVSGVSGLPLVVPLQQKNCLAECRISGGTQCCPVSSLPGQPFLSI